jgi:hypothetical protein
MSPFPVVGQTIYGGWSQEGEAYADLKTRFSSFNTKLSGLICDGVADDRARLDTLVNTTMQPNGGELDVIGVVRIGSNVSIPSNVRLNFRAGAYIAPDVGQAVTINGTINAPLLKVFGGGGVIAFGNTDHIDVAYPQWWGATGDDATNNLTALNACKDATKAAGIRMHVPKGVYRHSGTITFTDQPHLTGIPGQTVFKPTGAIGANPAIVINNTVQAFGAGDWNPVEYITVDGTLNPTGTGIAWGTNALTSSLTARCCRAINFTGAGGIGMTFGNLVDCEFTKFYCRNNTEAGKIVASDPNCPTTCSWVQCQWRESTGTTTGGLVILQGYDLSFPKNIFESNKARGCYIPATGVVVLVSFDHSWFEGNWLGDGAPLTKFAFQADGSGVGGDVSDIDLTKCKFSAQTKSVSLKSVANFTLDRNSYPNIAATIEVLANAYGRILNDPRAVNQDYTKLLTVSGAGASVTKQSQLADSETSDRGDAAFALALGVDGTYQKGIAALTANRLVTLSDLTTPSSGSGGRFIITHSAADAFNYNVQRQDGTLLKAVPQNTWSEFYHDGLVWKYFRSGTV